MASNPLLIKVFVAETEYHFDNLTLASTLADVKKALKKKTGIKEDRWTVGRHGEDDDEVIEADDTASLGEVFGNDITTIELEAWTPSLGERKRNVFSWRPHDNKIRLVLNVDNRNYFQVYRLRPDVMNPIEFMGRKNTLYLVDEVTGNEQGRRDPKTIHYQIRKFVIHDEGDIIIDERGTINIGEVQRDRQGKIFEPKVNVQIPYERGVLKQYREEWNTNITRRDKHIKLTLEVAKVLASPLVEAAAGLLAA